LLVRPSTLSHARFAIPFLPAGTITNAAKVLHLEGAREVYACCTHAVFSPPAVERLSSGVFQEVIVANTIPVPPSHQFPELTVLSGERRGFMDGTAALLAAHVGVVCRTEPALQLLQF
jgi:hypothetical protein